MTRLPLAPGSRRWGCWVPAGTLAGHLVHEITVRGAQGGPLTPLADQLNHDTTHLQGLRLEGMLAQVVSLVTALAEVGRGPQVPRKPVRLAPRPGMLAGPEELLADLDAKLTGGDDAGPRIVALCGLGGAEKNSQLIAAWHIINDNVGYDDLGPLHFLTRIDPARQARRLVTQLQQLGYRVELNPGGGS
jgi:hypothetical protein